MGPFATGSIIMILVLFSFACNKSSGDEAELYGTWVKGSNAGDTLWFMKKNGRDIMRQPESFSPLCLPIRKKNSTLRMEN
jgi:hypothetical protein